MFLLIPIWHGQLQIPLANFKFHYVSINSGTVIGMPFQRHIALNSIMFLLIQRLEKNLSMCTYL